MAANPLRLRATAKEDFYFTSYLEDEHLLDGKIIHYCGIRYSKCPRSVGNCLQGFVAHSWRIFSNDAKSYFENGDENIRHRQKHIQSQAWYIL